MIETGLADCGALLQKECLQMAVMEEHLRIVAIDRDGTDQSDRYGVVALPDRTPGPDPANRIVANALLQSLQAIQGEVTLHGRLERLVEATVELLQRADVAVAMLSETGETFEISAAAGRLLATPGRRAAVLDDLVRSIARCGRSCVLGDVVLDPPGQVDKAAIVWETRSWLGVPLTRATGAFGALVVADTTPHSFGPDDEQALTALASLASAALDDARSLELARRGQAAGDEREPRLRDVAETSADCSWEQDEHLKSTCSSSVCQCPRDPWGHGALGRGDRMWKSTISGTSVLDASGVIGGCRGSMTDLTNAQEAENPATESSGALATRNRQLAAIADLGQFAFAADDLQDVLNAAAMVVADVLGADCSQTVRLRPDGTTLVIEAGLAVPDGLTVSHLPRIDSQSQYGYVLAVGEPVIVAELAREARFRPMPALLERGMVSGVLVPITRRGRCYGLLGVHARRAVHFADEDVQFLCSVANVLMTAIDAARSRNVSEALIEQAPDAIARFDADLRLLAANLALGLTLGRPVSELLGQTIRTLISAPSPQVDNWEAIARSVLRSGREREAELSWPTPFGDRELQMRFVPELGADHQVESLLVVARDVTDRKRLHDERAALYEELLERDLRLRDLIGHLRVEHREERAHDRRLADAAFIESQMTAREVEILGMVVAGLTNQQIASRLHLSAGTVRNRLGHLFPKLDVVNRAQAAARAVELGLVTPSGV